MSTGSTGERMRSAEGARGGATARSGRGARMLGLVLLLLLGAGGLWLGRSASAVPPPPEPVAPREAVAEVPPTREAPLPRAQVVEVVGEVERTRGETWVGLRVGDALGLDESVRTGAGARVELRMGDDLSRLSIPERSEVRVGEVTRAVHTVLLERGRIDVDYRGDEARVLRVRSQGGAVVETREARFTMLRRGTLVAVVTRGGSVDLSSAGATIQVGAGQQGIALDGMRPVGPQPIPLDVLLRVARAPGNPPALCVSLEGQVRLGTEVWVEDAVAEVSGAGRFRADVPRAPGRSRVRVVAREPGGLIREAFLACRADARGGASRPESVKFHWDGAP